MPLFATRQLQKISSQELEAFMDRLVTKEKLSPTTRNRVRAVLHKLYNDAKRQGHVQVNPVSNVMLWKESRDAFDYLHSIEECQTYLIHARTESPSFYAFAVLALNTGARLGEIIALQNQDVDIHARRIHIWKLKEYRNGEICKRTKGGSDRWLGLNDEIAEVLIENRKLGFAKPKDFIVHENGESMYSCKIRQIHWRVCKRAGLRRIRVHDLRHTFASHYVMNGGTLHDLQALLGHSSPMMTQRYAHLAPGYLESKANVVRIGMGVRNVSALKLAT